MNATDICNMALSYLSKGKILSMEEQNEEAKQCKIHYEHCRRSLLRKYSWGFAKRLVRLSQLAYEVPGWDYVYAYPPECISVRLIFDNDAAYTRAKDRNAFEVLNIAGDIQGIGTNIENAWAEITYNVNNVERYSEEFCEALSRLLASAMAQTLTGNANLQMTNLQLAQAAVQEAKIQAATERERMTTLPDDYANARFN